MIKRTRKTSNGDRLHNIIVEEKDNNLPVSENSKTLENSQEPWKPLMRLCKEAITLILLSLIGHGTTLEKASHIAFGRLHSQRSLSLAGKGQPVLMSHFFQPTSYSVALCIYPCPISMSSDVRVDLSWNVRNRFSDFLVESRGCGLTYRISWWPCVHLEMKQ